MRNIDLPPVKTLPFRAWVSVMVVVPTLPKSDQRQNEAVLTVVGRLKAATPDDVSCRINHKRTVVKECGTDTEAPSEELHRRGPQLRAVNLKRPSGNQ